MPRTKVYGKRSRSVYAPLASFVSPDRPAVTRTQQISVAEITKELEHQLVIQDDGLRTVVAAERKRRPLSQRDANTRVKPVACTTLKGRKQAETKTKSWTVDVTIPTENGILEDDNEVHGNESPGNRTPALPGKTSKLPPSILVDQVDNENGDIHVISDTDVLEIVVSANEEVPLKGPEGVEEALSRSPSTGLEPSLSRHPARPYDAHSEHCARLLDLSQHPLTLFSSWAAELSTHFSITKIAEASFGEVYRLSLRQRLSDISSSDESVLKIIALRPPLSALPKDKRRRECADKKVEAMTKPNDVANEVRLLQRMTNTPGFTNFRDIRVLRGRPPRPFVRAFKAFNASQKTHGKDVSVFPDPARKTSYSDDQLWAVIEMQDAGTDLERLLETEKATSIWTAWDVFWQVTLSLAKGEEGAEFEHRDLHLGNICVRQSSQARNSIDVRRKLAFTTLETTIIDYTISRATIPRPIDTDDGSEDVAYADLSLTPDLFIADATEEYQYDIYRYMRSAFYLDEPGAVFEMRYRAVKEVHRCWRDFRPMTNLVWLHFVLYKLLDRVEWPSAAREPPKCKKAEKAQWKKANVLEHVLQRVNALLDPGNIPSSGLRSASELVGLAVSEAWLDVEDVVGIVERNVEQEDGPEMPIYPR